MSLAEAAAALSTAPPLHDGDTLRLGLERVRLFGVDGPEVRRGQTPTAPFAAAAVIWSGLATE